MRDSSQWVRKTRVHLGGMWDACAADKGCCVAPRLLVVLGPSGSLSCVYRAQDLKVPSVNFSSRLLRAQIFPGVASPTYSVPPVGVLSHHFRAPVLPTQSWAGGLPSFVRGREREKERQIHRKREGETERGRERGGCGGLLTTQKGTWSQSVGRSDLPSAVHTVTPSLHPGPCVPVPGDPPGASEPCDSPDWRLGGGCGPPGGETRFYRSEL